VDGLGHYRGSTCSWSAKTSTKSRSSCWGRSLAAAIAGQAALITRPRCRSFNFGESTPEIPRFLPDRTSGPWNWRTPVCTTGIPLGSAKKHRGRVPPLDDLCLVAPRRFVYAYELGWQVEQLPAWARYRRVFGLYVRATTWQRLTASAVSGPGECWNIGPHKGVRFHPTLERWFGSRFRSRDETLHAPIWRGCPATAGPSQSSRL